MDRRTFLGTAAALGFIGVPLVRAQPASKTYRIGYLAAGPRPADDTLPVSLREELDRFGYREGKNITYIGRWAESRKDRLPGLAAELVALGVDVMVTFGSPAAASAKQATSTIPVVMALSGDPVGVGLIESLARPGSNITGMTDNATALSAKRLEILKEAIPTASHIAVLWNASDQAMMLRYREINRAAAVLGVSVQPLGVREPDDFDQALAAMDRQPPDAIFMVTDALTNLNRKRVLDYAEAHRIPAMYEYASLVREGGLMSYGPGLDDMFRQAAVYIDKILRGAKPGELPVEQPTRYYLAFNLKTAKALGLTIPRDLLLRADEVFK
jgi:putative ABC transport system substrate-binding protein